MDTGMPTSLVDLQERVKNMGINVRVLERLEIEPYLDQIAAARIRFFKEFPYLYQGTMQYEIEYLKMYRDIENARIIIGEKNGHIVGFSTGVPLGSDYEFLKELSSLVDTPEDYYYLGEAIIDPEYRGLGTAFIGTRTLEQIAFSLGYPKICFIGIEREKNHPLRPSNYRDITPLMTRLGYQKTDRIFEPVYPTIQSNRSVVDMPNKMAFWVSKSIYSF
jgi:hypothetical protein